MYRLRRMLPLILITGLLSSHPVTGFSEEVRLLRRKHDPYGAPQPAIGQESVPLRTTFYVPLAIC